MKILHLTDTHFMVKCNQRLDADYAQTCLAEWELILSQDVDLIIHAGDFFDSHDQPRWFLREFLILNAKYLSEKKQLVMTLGQHDVANHNIHAWHKSAVGVLETNPFVTVLVDPAFPAVFDDVEVFGFAFGLETTAQYLRGENVFTKTKNNRIGLVHASIGQEEMPWMQAATSVNPTLPLTFFGDIHDGFDIVQDGNRYWWNIGAFSCKSVTDRDRKPPYIIFDSDDFANTCEQFFIEISPDLFIEVPEKTVSEVSSTEYVSALIAMRNKTETSTPEQFVSEVNDRLFKFPSEVESEVLRNLGGTQ